MPRTHKERHILVKPHPCFNAQEVVLLDRLLDTGLYGATRDQVIRRLVDQQLCELFGKNGPLQIQETR